MCIDVYVCFYRRRRRINMWQLIALAILFYQCHRRKCNYYFIDGEIIIDITTTTTTTVVCIGRARFRSSTSLMIHTHTMYLSLHSRWYYFPTSFLSCLRLVWSKEIRVGVLPGVGLGLVKWIFSDIETMDKFMVIFSIIVRQSRHDHTHRRNNNAYEYMRIRRIYILTPAHARFLRFWCWCV